MQASELQTFPSLAAADEQGVVEKDIWLLGQPSLSSYLGYVHDVVIDGETIPPQMLVDEWRAANDYYHELEETEYGLADRVECHDLEPPMAELAERLAEHPHFRRTFEELPTTVKLVELDKLVVCQRSVGGRLIAADTTRARAATLRDPEALFHYCLPTERTNAPVQTIRLGSGRWLFRSDSLDFRSHGVKRLDSEQRRALESFGPVSETVAVMVGYCGNYVNAVEAEGRLILNNGYHRVYVLRALGCTHAPCVIQSVTRGDELRLAAKEKVAADPDFYLKTARPPMIKDFFDPKIRKVLRVRRQMRIIEVSVEVRELFASA